MINFKDFSYLQNGNSIQKQAFKTITVLQVFEVLKNFTPVLTGTIPINIDIETSDLDIICCSKNLDQFKKILVSSFGDKNKFELYEKMIRNQQTVIARFKQDNFIVEIFGQDRNIEEQEAYRHMLIEHKVLQNKGDNFRLKIIELKKQGLKTEPAFAKLLGLKGDPYIELLKFGELLS